MSTDLQTKWKLVPVEPSEAGSKGPVAYVFALPLEARGHDIFDANGEVVAFAPDGYALPIVRTLNQHDEVVTELEKASASLNDNTVLQNDLRELLQILGLPDGAQPRSPHDVFQSALAVLRAKTGLVEAPPQDSNADAWHLFLCERLDNRANHPNGLTYCAVQIAEAIEAAEARAASPSPAKGQSKDGGAP